MNKKPNIDILKEPKGFIKGIELVITIFAFATVAGALGHLEFSVKCSGGNPPSRRVKADFSYPFNSMRVYASSKTSCTNETGFATKETLPLSYKSEAEYFVFTGVVSMIFVLVAATYYLFFEDRAKDATATDIGLLSFPVVDFVFTIVLVIFWFTSSIAWASGLSGLKKATSEEAIFKAYKPCHADYPYTNGCSSFDGARYGAATVAVVFGFLNFFVWAGNLWFLFKETPWHSPKSSGVRGSEIPQEPPHQDTPPANSV